MKIDKLLKILTNEKNAKNWMSTEISSLRRLQHKKFFIFVISFSSIIGWVCPILLLSTTIMWKMKQWRTLTHIFLPQKSKMNFFAPPITFYETKVNNDGREKKKKNCLFYVWMGISLVIGLIKYQTQFTYLIHKKKTFATLASRGKQKSYYCLISWNIVGKYFIFFQTCKLQPVLSPFIILMPLFLSGS